jgi:signal transduction histidine kinase
MAQSDSKDILADFAHQLRQPLSAIEALACYMDLIAKPEDELIHEQLRRMHAEIVRADQILRDGLCTVRAALINHGSSVLAGDPGGVPKIFHQPDQY